MKIHFIGIGGISMSALCKILHSRGDIISGSDCTESAVIKSLKEMNIDINIGHSRRDFSDCDLVVYTTAVGEENPELKAARAEKVTVLERAELLGLLAREYECVVAVCGSHGKTTTSAMLAHLMLEKNPTIHIGGQLEKLHGNCRVGESGGFFITEACEYKRSFLHLMPNIAVVLNIDGDHLDYFKDLDDVKSAFSAFLGNVAPEGMVIVSAQDNNAVETAKKSGKKVVMTGLDKEFDYSAQNIVFDTAAHAEFDLFINGKFSIRIKNSVPGMHNVFNALSAAAAAHIMGVSPERIKEVLGEFKGADRRWQRMGSVNGAEVYLDYAHHPNEIKVTINTAKTLKPERILVVFQPHTYTRTAKLWKDFVDILSQGDEVFLCPIYPAREKPMPYITSENLARDIYNKNKKTRFCKSFYTLGKEIKARAQKGDLVLVLGAGDIEKAVDDILN